jgi:fumarate reductase iron-sulfur subunit
METITVRLRRFDPTNDTAPHFQEYRVPLTPGMSAMNVLDHIYEHFDGTIAYYDHAACALGVCLRCQGRINGKPGLLCQTLVTGNVVIEPPARSAVVFDLVVNERLTKEKNDDN